MAVRTILRWSGKSLLIVLFLLWPVLAIATIFSALAFYDVTLAFALLEGPIAALLMVAAGIFAIVAVAYGGVKAWRIWSSCLILAISLFIVRSLFALT